MMWVAVCGSKKMFLLHISASAQNTQTELLLTFELLKTTAMQIQTVITWSWKNPRGFPTAI